MLNQIVNGTVRVGNEVVSISRTSDFNDFLAEGARDLQFRVVQVLKETCASMGETRSAIGDLYRQRLQQMREHLRVH